MLAKGDSYSKLGYGRGAFATLTINSAQVDVGWFPVVTANTYYNGDISTKIFSSNNLGNLLLSNNPNDCCDKTHKLATNNDYTSIDVSSFEATAPISHTNSWVLWEQGTPV